MFKGLSDAVVWTVAAISAAGAASIATILIAAYRGTVDRMSDQALARWLLLLGPFIVAAGGVWWWLILRG